MSRDFDRRFYDEDEREEVKPRRPAPGKVSLTSRISADSPADPRGTAAVRPRGGVVRMKRAAGGVGFGDAVAGDMATVGLHAGSDAEHAGTAIAEKGSGSPLPSALASRFEHAYGVPLGDTRVHTDSSAAAAASRTGARAFTYGADIFFGSGQYAPGTDEGDRLIGHELAHVAQQGTAPQAQGEHGDQLLVGQVGDAQEREADTAAEIALAGGTATVRKAGPALRFDKQAGMGRGGHAQPTEESLMEGVVDIENKSGIGAGEKTKGLSAEEAHRARMLNWMQDFNQVFQSTTKILHLIEPLKPIIEILAIKEFGIGIDWNKMGTYDPVRHIDRPDGLKGGDVLDQSPKKPSERLEDGDITIHGREETEADKEARERGFEPGGINSDSVGGGRGTTLRTEGDRAKGIGHGETGPDPNRSPYHELEKRYQNLPDHKDAKKILNPTDAKAFQVNSTGMPAYIAASKEQTKIEFMKAATLGTKGAKKGEWNPEAKDLTGPELYSAAVHTLQDYPTHCNYVEVAINILLRESALALSGEDPNKDDEEEKAKVLKVLDESGELIELDDSRTVDTGVHAKGETAREGGHVKNYTITVPKKDEEGNVLKDKKTGKPMTEQREVLTSGGFDILDTAESLVAGLKDAVDGIDPMAEGPPAMLYAVLDYIEKQEGSTADFSKVGNMVKATVGAINSLASGAGGVAGKLVSGAGKAVSAGAGVVATGVGWFGSAARAVGADSVANLASKVSSGVRGAGSAAEDKASEIADAIKKVTDKLIVLEGFDGQSTLRKAHEWMSKTMKNTITDLIDASGRIPIIGPEVKKMLTALREELKSLIKTAIAAAWGVVKQRMLKKIEAAATGLAEARAAKAGFSEKMEKGFSFGGGISVFGIDINFSVNKPAQPDPTKSKTMTDPGHSHVSKDHADFWIEEVPGSKPPEYKVKEVKKLVLTNKKNERGDVTDPEVKYREPERVKPSKWLEKMGIKPPEHKKKTLEEDFNPKNMMQALAPVAQGLVAKMTRMVHDKIAIAWAKADRQGHPLPHDDETVKDVGAAVDDVWKHPADNRPLWEGMVRKFLTTSGFGPAFLKYLRAGK